MLEARPDSFKWTTRGACLTLLAGSSLASLAACGPALLEDVEDGSVLDSSTLNSATSPAALGFQDGVSPTASYAGTSDTSLEESAPTTQRGSDTVGRVDSDYPNGTGRIANSLMRFDVSAIPPGSTVTAANLILNVSNRSSSPGHALYPLSRSWSETEATWKSATSRSAWSSQGTRGAADRTETALATFTILSNGKVTIAFNAAGLAAVQEWIADPSSNHGFAIDGPPNPDGLIFDSAEAATATDRPRLEVTYQPPVPSNGTGLTGQYHSGKSFETLLLNQTDATLDFSWAGSPAAGVPADAFSVRWTGKVAPLYSQTYRFFTLSDDGVRLWVNDQLLVDNWTNHGATENSGAIALTAGQKYDVRVEYYDSTHSARLALRWESVSQIKQVIPASQLFPATVEPVPPQEPKLTRAEREALVLGTYLPGPNTTGLLPGWTPARLTPVYPNASGYISIISPGPYSPLRNLGTSVPINST